MKKFLLGYFIGGIISAIATDYVVRTQIYMALTEKSKKARFN